MTNKLPRRPVLLFLGSLPLAALAQTGPFAALPTLVMPDIDLLEDHPNPALAADNARRVKAVSQQLREGLAQAGLYRLVDPAPAQATITELRAAHANLFECNGCAQSIGKAAGSDLVLVGWVQKVSELILNLNVELREVAGDRTLLNKSVDMRGNNDESWQRAARFMLRDWSEKRAANPRYGLP
ncbi:DUF3280 domain-containing protein [Rivibacter subsaxonicus]|uniref:Uncharacterized protein DUF2380 n=1 Tax=Rivibacter subsaxonicus TaxID=457575 RepID=A0A4Q7VZH0_9BURK|nr:DUF3280 domain-containing protein [Rivibacter subsaxonicus]RZU02227.1 uncharacterized protein DUF2380 [Rivibacter subsaxonicus]